MRRQVLHDYRGHAGAWRQAVEQGRDCFKTAD
jgi:hypothetical protein